MEADSGPGNGSALPQSCDSLALVSIHGADARTFLQGMLTSDVHELDDGRRWQQSALCNPKGRIIASFALWKPGEDAYCALMPREMVGEFCPKLKMFVLRAKVKVDPLDGQVLLAGREDTTRSSGQAGSGEVLDADGGKVLAGAGGVDLLVREAPAGNGQGQGDSQWARAQIARGIPWITKATQGMFIAQSINYDLLGGVSFQKGCFVGQEVIARVHYRGEAKSRMYRVAGDGPPPEVGAAIHSRKYGDQVAGNIVNSCATEDGEGFAALVSTRKSAVEDGVSITTAAGTSNLRPEEILY